MPRKKYYKKTDANKNYWCNKCEELSKNKTCLHCNKQNEKVSNESWCEEKVNGEECGQLSYFEAEWVNGGGHDCHAPHSYDYLLLVIKSLVGRLREFGCHDDNYLYF